ncbi:MAG: hypothetical protein COX77_05070 [Candidatus Komeilibacteria bacterium CG_4_10_14_0_2_um_filter_37_10]|uniref:DNA 3'-5' helicase n=1 Tax=Candidatus Komeilibacteria bacterium CG_4_10_14_0_2_um_filter_37_10 TaxID=1974470 RepID=A0A2M7VD19_9BACT|nr:MAG: hypothetical protein COX77_05070 [Candidatus Komeilibacteria bacterium CG_4_10_14_0_2_um_filter_37_10]
MTKIYKIKKELNNSDVNIDFARELNKEQYQVVTRADGPCLVLAGAGSGKTRTIVYRLAFLLQQGVPAERILLLTFTNKAAREMVARTEELLKVYPDGLWAGTFHHIANRLLRQYAKLIGYQSNYNILDAQDSVDLVKKCLREAGIDTKQRRFPSAAVLQDIFSYQQNSQKDLADIITYKHPQWVNLLSDIESIQRLYQQKKQSNQVMDFDDLLVNLLKLLQQEKKISQKLAQQFLYILVDEYQDTNHLQAQLVKHLSAAHHNILVVGDDAQSIYSFRAADIGNILDFPQMFSDVKVFKLEYNYRSTPDILAVANDIISNNINQYQKELKTTLDSFIKPQLLPCLTPKQEAELISSLIIKIHEEGVPFSKMAVLFRAAHHSQNLEMELNKKNISYDYRGGLRFFARAHIKDVVSYLRVLNNPADEISWSRILNLQVGIGAAGAEQLIDQIRASKSASMQEIINAEWSLSSRSVNGWQSVCSTLRPVLSLMNTGPVSVGEIVRILTRSDYKNYLENEYPDWQQRLSDLEQFSFYADSYQDLNAFLSEVSLQENFSLQKEKQEHTSEDQLVLSTIHQAKGLEWRVVFIINLIENAFPNQRALQEKGGLEEERRLFYVAVTRAQQQLYLTYPIVGAGSGYLNQASQFLAEIDRHKLERGRVENSDQLDESLVIEVDEEGNRTSFLPDLDDL